MPTAAEIMEETEEPVAVLRVVPEEEVRLKEAEPEQPEPVLEAALRVLSEIPQLAEIQ